MWFCERKDMASNHYHIPTNNGHFGYSIAVANSIIRAYFDILLDFTVSRSYIIFLFAII